jgi:hypothetical protein
LLQGGTDGVALSSRDLLSQGLGPELGRNNACSPSSTCP